MIAVEIKNGEGLGNQLARYVTTRVIAEDNGYIFSTINPSKFKGLDFLDLDFGQKVSTKKDKEESLGIKNFYTEREKLHPENGSDIRFYDENLIKVSDNTEIDGIMQDEQYIIHKKDTIREWLKIKKEFERFDYSNENICVINFRGGEYVRHKELFLTQKYWDDAIIHMKNINPEMKFIVVTDDIKTARKFFPRLEISHDSIGSDYSIINNAYYLILSNSSFAFFPTWLNEKVKIVIAPKYWARHNISDGYWSSSQNIVKGWMYQDREGMLSNYEKCREEFNEFRKNNPQIYNGSITYKPSVKKRVYLYFKKNIVPKWIKNLIKRIKQ